MIEFLLIDKIDYGQENHFRQIIFKSPCRSLSRFQLRQKSKNFIANAHRFALHLRPKFLIHAIISPFKKI
jgi:hypothetical protein